MIYFIGADGSNKVKVGYAKNSRKRLREHQVGSPVPLHLIAEFEGSPVDERDAHRAIGRGFQSGEWFPRPKAMQLKRSIERAGLSALPAFIRWRENEKRSAAQRLTFNAKAVDLITRNLARTTLATFSPREVKPATGLTAATWLNAAKGLNRPGAHALWNSLNYAPSHMENLLWALARRRVWSITDNEALECEPEIDAAMEALASLKARCLAIRKARTAA